MTWNFTECLRLARKRKKKKTQTKGLQVSLWSNAVSAWIIGKDKKAQCAMKNKMKNKESEHLTPMLRVWRGNQARKGGGKWGKQIRKQNKTKKPMRYQSRIEVQNQCQKKTERFLLPHADCTAEKKGISLGWSHEKSSVLISYENDKENNSRVAGKRRWCSVIKMDRESYFSLFL